MKTRSVVALSGALLVLFTLGLLTASAQGGPAVDWWVVAGGGAPSGGGTVTLNDTLGQPITGPSSGGSVGLADGYWAVTAAPLAVTDLEAAGAGGPPACDCQLDWSSVDGSGITYSIYRTPDQPYVPPVTPLASSLTEPTYSDDGALPGPAHAYYYVVRVFQGGTASPPSNWVGMFSYTLTPGSP